MRPDGSLLDKYVGRALRTLGGVSKTEEDLETSASATGSNALTPDSSADLDGPSTAELDAIDEALIESISEYASGDEPLAAPTDDSLPVAEAAVTFVAVADADVDAASDPPLMQDVAEAADPVVEDDEAFDVPNIVTATDDAAPDAVAIDTVAIDTVAPDTGAIDAVVGAASETTSAKTTEIPEVPEVSHDIIEELRRADIDGPVVDHAPQDDSSAGRRRPKRAIDYDPAPVPVPLKVPRILGRKPRVRKVTRVVRHVDPWSVFKIALLANLVLYLIVLTAGVLLWNVAYATGTVENVERFFESFGWQSFEFKGGELYHSAWIAGLFAVLGLTGLWVLLATLFNLITDLVGGVRFTVLEEEVVESRTSPMRRFVIRRPEPEIPVTLSDGSGPLIRDAVVDDTGGLAR